MRGFKLLMACLFIFLSSCEERLEEQFVGSDPGLIAVEGNLTNESKSHRIRITHPYQQVNGTPAPATGAVVLVLEGATRVFLLTESPAGSGEYFTPDMTAVFGRAYTLLIRYQGKDYTAQAFSTPVEPLTTLDYEKTDDDKYQLVLSQAGFEPNFIEHQITWTNTPECTATTGCEGRVIFYDLKNIDVQEIFKPEKTEFDFPENTIVVRRKFSVSPPYKDYLRSVLSETEWRGGVFDVQRANAPGNLSEGAIGFFAVSSVVSDTTIIIKKP